MATRTDRQAWRRQVKPVAVEPELVLDGLDDRLWCGDSTEAATALQEVRARLSAYQQRTARQPKEHA